MNPRHLQRLLGHSSITTTEKYVHLSESSLKDAVQRHRLPISRRPKKDTERKMEVNRFVTDLLENREKYVSYLFKIGARDPDDIIQDSVIDMAQSPPPEAMRTEAAVRKRLKWMLLGQLRGERALKRGGGRVASLDTIPEGLI